MTRLLNALSICCCLLALLGGCHSNPGPAEYIFGLADVASVEVAVSDEYPDGLSAIVRGNLRDACTRINSVKQERKGSTFLVTVTTERPIDDVCAKVDTPFEATIPLPLESLPAGEYSVVANDVSATFRWSGPTAIPRR